MKTTGLFQLSAVLALCLPVACWSQVNSGSDGHDGAFNPTTNTVVNMADHPNGIYHYTSVNIPAGVTVTFIPNTNNTPVVWLVQSSCVIDGTINLNGSPVGGPAGQAGGPGGGAGGQAGNPPLQGRGLGGGGVDSLSSTKVGGNASFGTLAESFENQHPSGSVYGNSFLLPLLGGSGGGGGVYNGCGSNGNGGGGGGGAILIAASDTVTINGSILANGGGVQPPPAEWCSELGGGGGSGGGVRIVATHVTGIGSITVLGGFGGRFTDHGYYLRPRAGGGRIRIDGFDITFNGSSGGEVSTGYQPIILQTNGQGAQLSITSVGGVPVSPAPTGVIATPDAVVSAQQAAPFPIAVHCANLALNTRITVSVRPANGATVSATGLNSTGTLASSTATVLINIPRGGGLIYATAATSN